MTSVHCIKERPTPIASASLSNLVEWLTAKPDCKAILAHTLPVYTTVNRNQRVSERLDVTKPRQIQGRTHGPSYDPGGHKAKSGQDKGEAKADKPGGITANSRAASTIRSGQRPGDMPK